MPEFKLTEDAAARLSAKFEEFQRERRMVDELLDDYVADYSRFEGSALARQEYLEERYSRRAPSLSHLIWNEDGEVYWNVPDIAIILGRQRPSITRAFARMEREDGWCARLLSMRREARAANGLPVHVYHHDIFNLLIDRYEEEYLRRFSEPRRGGGENAPDIEEVRRFWEYLRSQARLRNEYALQRDMAEENEGEEEKFIEMPELPPLPRIRWKDVVSMIWRRVFSVHTGMFLSIAFAVSFEFVRRWPRLLPYVVAASALTFMTCAALIHFRKGKPGFLAGVGAGAMLFALLWGAGLLSLDDGLIRTPAGMTVAIREKEHRLSLTPELMNKRFLDKRLALIVSCEIGDLREILYRVRPDGEYHSTGFTSSTNPATGLPYPSLVISLQQTGGNIELDVKCSGKDGREYGPWTFSVDIDGELFKLQKQEILTMNMKRPWVTLSGPFYEWDGEHSPSRCFVVGTNFLLLYTYLKEAISSIVYGVNTEQPDTVLDIGEIRDTDLAYIRDKDARYVTSYIIFKDGTASDIRISQLKN